MTTNVLGAILAKAWMRTGNGSKPGWGWACNCLVCSDIRKHLREPEGKSVPESVRSAL